MKVAVVNPDGTRQYASWVRSLEVLNETNHDPNCSGCPICSESARAALRVMHALDDAPPAPPDTIAAIRGRGNSFIPSQYARDAYSVATRVLDHSALRTASTESGEAPSLTHNDFVNAIKRSRGMV